MTSLRIPFLSKGAMMSLNCPCSKKITGWVKLFAIHHPGALLGPLSIRESSLTFWYYHSIRESIHSFRTLHGASLGSA
jgi:hypothetical protein